MEVGHQKLSSFPEIQFLFPLHMFHVLDLQIFSAQFFSHNHAKFLQRPEKKHEEGNALVLQFSFDGG